MDLNDLQFRILDSLYFVEPFDRILEEAGEPETSVGSELKQLIAHKLVQPMRFDEQAQDYVHSLYYDADDLRAYHYLATKEGLLKHAGRR